MKEKTIKQKARHSIFVILATIVVAGGLAVFLYNKSFNPDFNKADAVSGATEKIHVENKEDGTVLLQYYSKDDIALSSDGYRMETIIVNNHTYHILEKNDLKNNSLGNVYNISENNPYKSNVTILSYDGDEEYQAAVNVIAGYLESQGYDVCVKSGSESMMLSRAHAGLFDAFLMSEEVAP